MIVRSSYAGMTVFLVTAAYSAACFFKPSANAASSRRPRIPIRPDQGLPYHVTSTLESRTDDLSVVGLSGLDRAGSGGAGGGVGDVPEPAAAMTVSDSIATNAMEKG